MNEYKMFEVAATAIIRRRRMRGTTYPFSYFEGDGLHEYLVTKRAATKRFWPNMWTVPGGHVEEQDCSSQEVGYGVLEKAIKREVYEETGVHIKNLQYLTNMHLKGQVIVISMVADYDFGDVIVDPKEVSEYRWVTLTEAGELPFIEGILEELFHSERVR